MGNSAGHDVAATGAHTREGVGGYGGVGGPSCLGTPEAVWKSSKILNLVHRERCPYRLARNFWSSAEIARFENPLTWAGSGRNPLTNHVLRLRTVSCAPA